METNNEVAERRTVALRMILGSAGTLILLLLVLAVLRPDMAMSMVHHVEAMMGMSAGSGS